RPPPRRRQPPSPTPTRSLSLHDALPISPPEPDRAVHEQIDPRTVGQARWDQAPQATRPGAPSSLGPDAGGDRHRPPRHRAEAARSEEHTSELQSPYDLVCRLLLEKKKKR